MNPLKSNLRKHTRHLEILSSAQLRSSRCYDRLIVIGPARWFSFPDHLFRAPRASRFDLIQYEWLADDWHLMPAFVGSMHPGTRIIESVEGPPPLKDDSLPAQDVVPRMSIWSQYVRPYRHLIAEPGQDNIQARLFLLEDGSAVFLEFQESASSLIIDLDAEEEKSVRRLPVLLTLNRECQFCCALEGGGSNNSIRGPDSGDHAGPLREMQAEWKLRLRRVVDGMTFLEASVKLLDLGAELANEFNWRNWLSPRSIKTHEKKDFSALMKFIGLGESSEYDRSSMCKIDSAHHRAGARMRRMLLRQVRNADLKDLVKKGKMTFELGPDGGGEFDCLSGDGSCVRFCSCASFKIISKN